MEVCIVGGAGTIGSVTAHTLGTLRPELDLTLVDVAEDAARGDATDIQHGNDHASHPVGAGRIDTPLGTVTAASPGPEAVASADAVVVAASGLGTQEGGRMTAIEENRAVMNEVGDWFSACDPRPVVTVTNPMDRMNYHLYRRSGWDRSRFVGYALSETARVADELARVCETTPENVSCPVLGEHGEHIVPVFSRATANGDPVTLTADQRESITDYARQIPYDIIQWRGAETSSRWVTGRGVATLVSRILDGGVDDPVGLSTPLAGEFGYEDVSLGVPVTLDADGVEAVHEWDLNDEERAALDAAYEAVAETTQ
jgi:malate dehydrogenase